MQLYGLFLLTKNLPVPLLGVNVSAKIVDYTAEVEITQYFANESTFNEEAKYIFPLDEKSSVCSFECSYNGKTIVGVVKEKDQAQRDYNVAVSQGKTAALLQQAGSSDVFQMSVGNIPPLTLVIAKLTYVTELMNDQERLQFVLPTHIAPRYTPYYSLSSNFTSKVAQANVPNGINLSSTFSVSSPASKVDSTHPIISSVDSDRKTGTVSLAIPAAMEKDIIINIHLEDSFAPRMIIEDSKYNQAAASFSFVPKFKLDSIPCEFIFIADRSGSMDEGQKMPNLKSALQLFLRSFPQDCYFNIISFGSTFYSLFHTSSKYDENSLQAASNYVNGMKADMGGTEILQPLSHILSQPQRYGYNRQIFLLTDGEVSNTSDVISVVKKCSGTTRVFTLGIGNNVSRALVAGVARAGNGTCEYVMDGERMERKIVKQLKRLNFHRIFSDKIDSMQPSLHQVQITWKFQPIITNSNQFSNTIVFPTSNSNFGSLIGHRADSSSEFSSTSPMIVNGPIQQAPYSVPPVFSGNRMLVYAIFPPGTIPYEATMTAMSPDGPLNLTVRASAKSIGSQLHKLAARAIIRDLEEGSSYLHSSTPYVQAHVIKSMIVQLGTTFQLASKYTSFIAVDHSQPNYFYPFPVVPIISPVTPMFYQTPSQPSSNQSFASTKTTTTTTSTTSISSNPYSYQNQQYLPPNIVSPSIPFPAFSPNVVSPSSSNPSILYSAPSSSTPPPPTTTNFDWSHVPTASYPGSSSNISFSQPTDSKSSPQHQNPVFLEDFDAAPVSDLFVMPSNAPQSQSTSMSNNLFGAVNSSISSDPFSTVNPPSPKNTNANLFDAFDNSLDKRTKLSQLTSLQAFNGSFEFNSALASVLGIDLYSLDAFAKSLNQAKNVIATALAVAFFEAYLDAFKDEWELLCEKSRKWILSLNVGLDIINKAKQFLLSKIHK